VKYEWSLSDRTMADITLSGNYQSRVRFDIVRSPVEAVEGGYVLANGEVGISFADHWRASVWVKNIFDRLYRTQTLNTSTGWTNQYGAPRTAGFNIAYKF
jgi:iron complex outermembrane receptor protein